MADVEIYRCTVRVVRRTGWSWGPDPKRLVQEIVRLIPALIARRLSAIFAEQSDFEFAEPVRLRIPVHLSDFAEESVGGGEHRAPTGKGTRFSLEQRVEQAVGKVFAPVQSSRQEPSPAAIGSHALSLRQEKPEARPAHAALFALLKRWHTEGLLARRLQDFSIDEIEIWHRVLLSAATTANVLRDEQDGTKQARIEALIRPHIGTFNGLERGERLRQRVAEAVQAAAELNIGIQDRALVQVLDRLVPAENPIAAGQKMEEGHARASIALPESHWGPASPAPQKPLQPMLPDQANASSAQIVRGDVAINCAIPFLLLGPLSRMGYLDLLPAVLDAGGVREESPLFAAALAYKVLPAPHRGWLRSEESRQTAATFSGLRSPVAEDRVRNFAHRASSHMTALNRLLTEFLMQGHASGSPVVLQRFGGDRGGVLLADFPGCFPVACEEHLSALLPLLSRLQSFVMLARDSADPQTLHDLQAANITFVTDAPPARNESWKRLPGGSWTNAPQAGPETAVASHALSMTREAAALWGTFGAARPALIHNNFPAFDWALTLAAAVAAGTIAWELWRGRGATNPQMLLERYCDLSACVQFGEQRILVQLPMGRRQRELSESGLLAAVPNVPWFGGRHVEFGGG